MSLKQYKTRYRKKGNQTRLRNVVSREAVDNYLARSNGKTWNWIKDLKREKLIDKIGMDNGFSFETDPYDHQLQCFYLGVKTSAFLFYLDMGAGKTKLMLDVFRYRKHKGQVKRMLVVVQNVVATDTWKDEIKTHAKDLSYVQLVGSADDRIRLVREDCDIALVNYHGLQVLLCDWERRQDKRGAHHKVINPQLVQEFSERYQMLVMDEVQYVTASGTSINYQLCEQLSDAMSYSYGMTGTPFGKDPLPVFYQYRLIDGGQTFGTNLNMFRSVFYKAQFTPWGRTYKFDARMAEEFNTMMLARSIRYEEKEFASMPPINYNVIPIRKHTDIEPYIDLLKKELKESYQGKGVTASLSSVYHRARMLTAGFASATVKTVDGEVIEKVVAHFKNPPKVIALRDLILNLPVGKKVVVFHVYVESGNVIAAELKKNKISCANLRGRDKERRSALDRFKNGDVQVLITSVAIGSTGLNLHRTCHYVVFYETPSDPKSRKQAEKRVHRGDQKEKVFVYDLVMQDTVDVGIYDQMKKGKDFFTLLMDTGRTRGLFS